MQHARGLCGTRELPVIIATGKLATWLAWRFPPATTVPSRQTQRRCTAGARQQLLESSRVHGTEVHGRSIDLQILRLNPQIATDAATPTMICTERGAGYVFDPQVRVLH